jgi:hypothetical protein
MVRPKVAAIKPARSPLKKGLSGRLGKNTIQVS